MDNLLGGLIVSVLVIAPKVRGFKSGRINGFLRANKIRCTPSFGGKIKPLAPCHTILLHIKITSRYEQRHFEGQIHNFLRQAPPVLLLGDLVGFP
jgi:hypothetical protein